MVALRSAALAGVGVVQLPLLMVQEQLTAATLVKVVPAWEPKPELIHAVFPPGAACSLRCGPSSTIWWSASPPSTRSDEESSGPCPRQPPHHGVTAEGTRSTAASGKWDHSGVAHLRYSVGLTPTRFRNTREK